MPDETPAPTPPRFATGPILSTPRALEAFERAGENPLTYLRRHVTGDWGDLDEYDKRENERSLDLGNRLLSAYYLSDGTKVWIITEADRSTTTFLLPEEY